MKHFIYLFILIFLLSFLPGCSTTPVTTDETENIQEEETIDTGKDETENIQEEETDTGEVDEIADIALIKEGKYSYAENDKLSSFSYPDDDPNSAYLAFWYNYGDSASVEDFNIADLDPTGGTYTVEGLRSRDMFNITIEPGEDYLDITIEPVEESTTMYINQLFGREGRSFSARYYLE